MNTYDVAEKFKSVQGEGLYAGTPMAFIRFIGCSVGKRICHACDTDFDKALNWRGGGRFSTHELRLWALPYEHVCLTGGEPLDQALHPLLAEFGTYSNGGPMIHIETSGTKDKTWTYEYLAEKKLWLCVSPKPGFREDVVMRADEIKVIVPGLGNGDGWPTLEDARRWADAGKLVYLQPRNSKFDVDSQNLRYVQDLIAQYPQFRLSVQMHKILKVQ